VNSVYEKSLENRCFYHHLLIRQWPDILMIVFSYLLDMFIQITDLGMAKCLRADGLPSPKLIFRLMMIIFRLILVRAFSPLPSSKTIQLSHLNISKLTTKRHTNTYSLVLFTYYYFFF